MTLIRMQIIADYCCFLNAFSSKKRIITYNIFSLLTNIFYLLHFKNFINLKLYQFIMVFYVIQFVASKKQIISAEFLSDIFCDIIYSLIDKPDEFGISLIEILAPF